MTTNELSGRPPIVDLDTWQAARDELLIREKAHTREGDAIAAARRRLPMVEIDGGVEVVGPDGPVPFRDGSPGVVDVTELSRLLGTPAAPVRSAAAARRLMQFPYSQDFSAIPEPGTAVFQPSISLAELDQAFAESP